MSKFVITSPAANPWLPCEVWLQIKPVSGSIAVHSRNLGSNQYDAAIVDTRHLTSAEFQLSDDSGPDTSGPPLGLSPDEQSFVWFAQGLEVSPRLGVANWRISQFICQTSRYRVGNATIRRFVCRPTVGSTYNRLDRANRVPLSCRSGSAHATRSSRHPFHRQHGSVDQ